MENEIFWGEHDDCSEEIKVFTHTHQESEGWEWFSSD